MLNLNLFTTFKLNNVLRLDNKSILNFRFLAVRDIVTITFVKKRIYIYIYNIIYIYSSCDFYPFKKLNY